MSVALLYRGPLASCNYACGYCPFARRPTSAGELEADRAALARFLGFLRGRSARELSVLFTPRGEALHHAHYQRALVELSRLPSIERVAIQTNLSVDPERWLADAEPARLGLWASYHPGQTSREGFLARCRALTRLGVRYSVGMVGKRELLPELEAMRAALPAEVYLWVNAYKHEGGELTAEERARVEAIDPLFSFSTVHASRGRRCLAGERALAVDGEGTLRRCHFVAEPLGDLYTPGDLERALLRRPCPAESCRCHLGYLYLEELGLLERFGAGYLERAPERPWR
jgi:MoaA/NifB/PqqE/SkfB family radical SAM enzyme